MFGRNRRDGRWAWRVCLIAVLAVAPASQVGCSVASWDAQATGGTHKTTWNHGLEISFTGWGIYIGPGRNSTTTVEHAFEAKAEGTGENEDPAAVAADEHAPKSD